MSRPVGDSRGLVSRGFDIIFQSSDWQSEICRPIPSWVKLKHEHLALSFPNSQGPFQGPHPEQSSHHVFISFLKLPPI